MMHLLRVIDRAGGYVFGGAEGANDTVWAVSMRNESSLMGAEDIQERWIDSKDEYDQIEREAEEAHMKMQEQQAMELDQVQPPAPAPAGEIDPDFGDMTVPEDSGIKVVRKK